MKKLTQENIQFIENYLESSGVKYVDVRLEMTDHVACEIEAKIEQGDARGFYEIFKSYMLAHKSTLLKSLKKFRKQADKKALRRVVKNLFLPKTIVFSIVVCMFIFFKWDFWTQIEGNEALTGLFVLGLLLLLYASFDQAKKYSVLNRLLFWFGMLNYFVFLKLLNIASETWSYVLVPFIIWLNVSAVKTFWELYRNYQKQYRIV